MAPETPKTIVGLQYKVNAFESFLNFPDNHQVIDGGIKNSGRLTFGDKLISANGKIR